jgi:ribosomal protein S18 acetylase RimI-like enzyme
MLTIKEIKGPEYTDSNLTKEDLINFLFKHLDRFGDSKKAIENSIDYALSESDGRGGFILTAYHEENLIGALVMNKTGTSGYIPENILVYVAVDSKYRGSGFGTEIVRKGIELAEGDVKLHVEYDNPAKRLYERMGFTNKYAEMRFIKKNNE